MGDVAEGEERRARVWGSEQGGWGVVFGMHFGMGLGVGVGCFGRWCWRDSGEVGGGVLKVL